MSQRLRPCCVPGCDNDTLRRYALPKDENVRKIWLERIGSDRLTNVKDYQILKNYMVCGLHFDKKCINPNGSLVKLSLPTLNLSNYKPPTEESVFMKTVQHLPKYITPEKVREALKCVKLASKDVGEVEGKCLTPVKDFSRVSGARKAPSTLFPLDEATTEPLPSTSAEISTSGEDLVLDISGVELLPPSPVQIPQESTQGSTEDVETLVETLTIDGTTLADTNLSNLSHSDIQQLEELSQELHLSNDMETEESEVIIESVDSEEIEEEIVQTELGAEDVEIETERVPSPEEILPDIKVRTTSVPPLRPLTIAPKPVKVPLTMKPMAGQQLLLLQGGGGSGQIVKLVTSQGQELNSSNFQLGRPVAIKPAMKTSQGNISLVQPKQVVMKKIITSTPKSITQKTATFTTSKGGQFVVLQKPDQVKLVPSHSTTLQTMPSPTKTITLQQAQEMGLITSKMLQQTHSTPKRTVLVNKAGTKTIKLVPQVGQSQILSLGNQKTVTVSSLKSPTKILPATQATGGTKMQKIIFKSSTTGQTLVPSAQIIQVAGSQGLGSGQLHQINIPGKGMQYIKFVSATSAETVSSTPTIITTQKTSTLTSPTNILLSEVKSSGGPSLAPKPLKSIVAKTSTGGQMVVLPNFVQSQQVSSNKVPIPMRHTPKPELPPVCNLEPNLESNGIRPRKPCNCTKSQCLKLYCDCFANGEFCYMCNCMSCFNNLGSEDHRQRAIKTCLERNPNAFRPKIGKAKNVPGDMAVRKHTKGCNCKRSGCLKNYCECYEAKIACSSNCKCVGCRNIEESLDKKGFLTVVEETPPHQQPARKTALKEVAHFRPRRSSNTKQPINFINEDVIEATSQCLLTIPDNDDHNNMEDDELTKRQIIEEFGRCLKEIIGYSAVNSN